MPGAAERSATVPPDQPETVSKLRRARLCLCCLLRAEPCGMSTSVCPTGLMRNSPISAPSMAVPRWLAWLVSVLLHSHQAVFPSFFFSNCRMLGLLVVALACVGPAIAYNNGVGATPPLGWNTWWFVAALCLHPTWLLWLSESR
jgi:hypothetical protein